MPLLTYETTAGMAVMQEAILFHALDMAISYK